MPGVMSWEEMNWLLPDFEETGLIYHGSQPGNLVSIFRNGLVHGYNGPADGHETIYNAHYRHRPRFIPGWVDPRMCNALRAPLSDPVHVRTTSRSAWTICSRCRDTVSC